MKKQNIGLVVILGGVAFIGYIWFNRNKPKLADKQLADLTAQSNSLQAGADNIDKPFEYSEEIIKKKRLFYRGVSVHVANIFFTLNDLSNIEPAYLYSLNWYKDIFNLSIIFTQNQVITDKTKRLDILKHFWQNINCWMIANCQMVTNFQPNKRMEKGGCKEHICTR